MHLTQPIKALSLDIWQTLIQLNPAFKPAQIRFLQEKAGVSNFALFQKIMQTIDRELDAESTTTGADFGFQERIKTIWKKLENENLELKIQANKLKTNVLEKWYLENEEIFVANPPKPIEADIGETLAQIRRKNIKIGLLSNTGFIRGATMRKVLGNMGILQETDFQFFSNESQIAKPDLRFFRLLEEKFACAAQEILHIGDNYEADYQGATQATWQTFWFSQKKHYLSESKPLQIGSIKQLLPIL